MTIFKNRTIKEIKFHILENLSSHTKRKGTKVPKGEQLEINLNYKVGIAFLVLKEVSGVYPFPVSTKEVIIEPGRVLFDGISLPKFGSSSEIKSGTDASSASSSSSYRWWIYFIIAAVIIFILYFGLGKKRIK